MSPHCHRGYGYVEPVKCPKGNRCESRYLITKLLETRGQEDFVTVMDYDVLTKNDYCNNEEDYMNCPIFSENKSEDDAEGD